MPINPGRRTPGPRYLRLRPPNFAPGSGSARAPPPDTERGPRPCPPLTSAAARREGGMEAARHRWAGAAAPLLPSRASAAQLRRNAAVLPTRPSFCPSVLLFFCPSVRPCPAPAPPAGSGRAGAGVATGAEPARSRRGRGGHGTCGGAGPVRGAAGPGRAGPMRGAQSPSLRLQPAGFLRQPGPPARPGWSPQRAPGSTASA